VKLLGITPGDDRDLAPWFEALGRAGLAELLVREPDRSESELASVVEEATRWIRRVVVHNKCAGAEDVAREFGLQVHSRALSCHSKDDVDAAFAGGATYCLLSPIWRPTSKPDDTRKPLGLAGFERAARGRAVYALGGVAPDHMPLLRQQNVYGVAVLGGLFGTSDPAAAAIALRAYL